MKVKAKAEFPYGGRRIRVGETVTMSNADARLMKALGRVEDYVEPVKTRAANADPLDHDEDGRKGGSKKGRKRNYQRRDMRAED